MSGDPLNPKEIKSVISRFFLLFLIRNPITTSEPRIRANKHITQVAKFSLIKFSPLITVVMKSDERIIGFF